MQVEEKKSPQQPLGGGKNTDKEESKDVKPNG